MPPAFALSQDQTLRFIKPSSTTPTPIKSDLSLSTTPTPSRPKQAIHQPQHNPKVTPAPATHPTHFHGQNTQAPPHPSKASVSQRYFLTSMKNRCGFKTTNSALPTQKPSFQIEHPSKGYRNQPKRLSQPPPHLSSRTGWRGTSSVSAIYGTDTEL